MPGYTVVEMLVASALGMLMMTALLGVLGTLAKHQKTLVERTPSRSWERELEAQIRWDLANSTRIRVFRNRFRLTGFTSHDLVTGEPTYRPATVSYEIMHDRYRSWLTRTESHAGMRTNRSWRRELLCSGVARLSLAVLEMEGDAAQNEVDLSSEEGPLPNGIRVMLFADAGRKPWFSRDIILRQNLPAEEEARER